MAIARVGTGSGIVTIAAASSLVVSYTPVGTGRLLTISGSGSLGTASVAPTVADSSSTSWTVKNQFRGSGAGWVTHAYQENNPAGLTSVTMTFPAGSYGHAAVDEWTGVRTSGAFDQQVSTNSDPTVVTSLASGNITLGDANGLVIAAGGADDSSNVAWTTTLGSWTQIFADGDSSVNAPSQVAYQIASGSVGPYSITWVYSVSNAPMGSNLVSFLPLNTAAPPPLVSPRRRRRRRQSTGSDWTAKGWFEPGTNNAAWFSRELVMPVASANTAALTSATATAQVGTVTPDIGKALTGNTATGAVGTVAPATDKALTNVAATTAVGSVGPNVTVALIGVSLSAQVGTVTAVGSGSSAALTSVTTTVQTGSVAPSADKALTSVSTVAQAGFVAPGVDKALTSVVAALQTGSVAPSTNSALTSVASAVSVGAVVAAADKALSGNSLTAAVGNVTPASDKALANVALTSAVGTLAANVTVALTGVSLSAQVGTVTAVTGSNTAALSGVVAAVEVGTLTPGVTVALTGVSLSAQVGAVAPGLSKALTGTASTVGVGALAPSITAALTGVSASAQVGTVSVPVNVRLRGFNFASLATPPKTRADFAAAAGYGANLVRIAVLPTLSGGVYALSQADLNYVSKTVESARCYGFRVCITMAPQPGNAASDWWGDAPKSNSLKAIWAAIAAKYVGDPIIYGYDLLNEPWLPVTLDAWYKSSTQTGLAVEMVDAIRVVDPNAPCIFEPGEVGGSGSKPAGFWPGGTPLVPLARSNIIYSYHFYDPPELVFQGILGYPAPLSYPTVYPYTQAYLSDVMQYIRLFTAAYPGVQMYCGEFSCIRSAPGATTTNWLSDAIALFAAEGHDWTYHAFREYQGFDPEIPLGPLATPGARTPTAEVITLLRGVLPGAFPAGYCPPEETSAHSAYLRQVLMEVYARDWEQDRLRREELRRIELEQQLPRAPRTYRVKKVTIVPGPAERQEEPPKIVPRTMSPVAEEAHIDAQELIGAAMKSVYAAQAFEKESKAKRDLRKQRRRAEERIIVEFLTVYINSKE